MIKNVFFALVLLLMTGVVAGCDNGHFKVDARLDGLDNQNVRVVFAGDSGLTDLWIPAHEGRLRFKGSAGRLTLLSLFSADGAQLAMLAVCNGETVEIAGDFRQPDGWTVTGSDVNERWWNFKKTHADLYSGQGTRRDEAIEDYAAQEVFDMMTPLLRRANLRLQPMLLYNRERRDFASLNADGKTLLLYLWTNRQPDRADHVRRLRDLWKNAGDSIVIADINLEADTSAWQSTLEADSARWQHYWAPGGPEDVAVKPLNIMYTPLYIVADSLGNQVYRGSDAQAAVNACRR